MRDEVDLIIPPGHFFDPFFLLLTRSWYRSIIHNSLPLSRDKNPPVKKKRRLEKSPTLPEKKTLQNGRARKREPLHFGEEQGKKTDRLSVWATKKRIQK